MQTLLTSLRYPLTGTLLAAILAFAVLDAVARFALSAGLAGMIIGVVMLVMLSIWVLAYSSVVFQSAATGRPEPPPMTANEMTPFGSAPVRDTFVLLFLFIAAGTLAQRYLPPGLAALTQLLLLTAMPASLSLQVVNGSLGEALSPPHILRTIGALGWRYATMPVALIVASVLYAVVSLMPLPGLLATAVGAYLYLAVVAFWGAVLYANAEHIGLEPTNAATVQQALIDADDRKTLEQAMDVAFAEATTNTGKALEQINALVDADPDPWARRRWVFERTRDWPNEMVPLRLAQTLIERDLQLGDEQNALSLATFGLSRNAAFRPATPDATLKLASVAGKSEKYEVATSLLGDFGSRFPEHPQRVAAALGAATVALGHLGDRALAQRLVASVASEPQARRHPRFEALCNALGFRVPAPHVTPTDAADASSGERPGST